MAAFNDDFIVKNGLVVRATNLSNYNSNSTQTGAITTPGGLGIGENAYIGGNLNVLTSATLAELQVNDVAKILSSAINTATVSAAGNALQVTGGIFAAAINISGTAFVKGSQVLTQADGFKGGVISQPLIINTTTNSTSTNTGALVTPGGIGIAQDMTIGGMLNVYGNIYSNGYQVPTLLTVAAGIGIAGGGVLSATNSVVTINNAGVLTLTAGTAINISTATGNVVVSNIGVTNALSGSGISISTSTGSIVVSSIDTLQSVTDRGAITSDVITLTNSAAQTGNTYNTLSNALNVVGGASFGSVNIANTSYLGGAQIVTTGTINQFIGGTILNPLQILNSTTSVNTVTGALIVSGGVGIGQTVNIGQNLSVGGNATIYGSLNVVGTYTTVIVNSTQTYLDSPLLDIGTGPNNSALGIDDGLDRGIVFHYNTGSNATFDTHAYLGRQHSTGLLVFLTDVQPGGTTEVLTNPIAGGNYGNVKFGSLQLVGGTQSLNTQSGDLQVVGGLGVGGNLYAGGIYDLSHRVLTNQSITSTAGSGIGVSAVTTTTGVTVSLTNTGVVNISAGTGISIKNAAGVSSQTGYLTITNIGVTSVSVPLTFNLGGDLSVSAPAGDITLSNLATLNSVMSRGNTSTYQMQLQNTGYGVTPATTSNNALTVAGGIWAQYLDINQAGYINGAQIVTSATINAFGGGIINNYLVINTSTHSTGTSSGAFVVAGGVGIGDNLNLQNTLTIYTTASTALYISGGETVMGNINLGGSLYSTGTIYAPGLTSNATNLYLNTSTIGGGTIYANGVNLLNYNSATWFVSTNNGSDSNDGRRLTSAFATLAKALTVATAGQAIYVDAGTYSEVFPLTIPAGVSVLGSGLRSTVITPTAGTKTNTAFYLNGEVLVSDLTVSGFYQPGWGFEFAVGAKITTKSPYIERVSVITKGSVTPAGDPYGFTQADAGNGVKLDASKLLFSSLEPACLFNEVTLIVPNATGLYMTNGVRAEWLNSFTYFANKSIDAEAGATGFAGVGQTRLKLVTTSGTFTAGDTLLYKDPAGNTIASGTIASNDGTYLYINGPSWGWAVAQNGTAKTINSFGTAQLSTAQKKFGTASALFNGTTDYLQVDSDSSLQFGTSDFTVECWIYPNAVGGGAVIFNKGNTNSSLTEYGVRFGTVSNTLRILGPNGVGTQGSTVLSTGQWYHIALVRKSATNTLTLFLNGNVEAQQTGDIYSVTSTDPLEIAADSINQRYYFSGYIDELRVSNYARYSSSFSPASVAYTFDSYTVMLTHFDGANGSTSFTCDTTLIQNISSTGSFPAQATQCTLVDLHQFGAELRAIGSASVFGNQGVIANGTGTDLKLIAYNVSNIGAGKDLTDDYTLAVQANEMIQTNGGIIYYQTVDQSGNFRVGTHFLVNQATGAVSFGNASLNLTNVTNLTVTDGTNTVNISPTGVVANNLSLSGNNFSSLTGNINITPAGTQTNINSNLSVAGQLSINSLAIPSGTDSVSTTTGALTVVGGVGIGADVTIGGTLSNITGIAGNAVSVLNGGVGAQTLYIATQGFINNAKIVTTATIGTVLGGNVPNALYITTTTNAVSTQTGAFTVAGGVGIGKDVWVGGTIYENGSPVLNTINLNLTGIAGDVLYNGTTATIELNNIGVTAIAAGTDISVSASTGTVTVSDSSTLQSVTNRGAQTTNALNVTNTSISTTTIINNAIQVPNGGIGAKTLYLDTAGYIQGSQILTTANAGSSFGGTFNNPIDITSNINAINTQSGALQVVGGVGIGKDLYVGGSTYILGDLFVDGTNTVVNTQSIQTGDKTITLSTGAGTAIVATGAGIQVGYSSSTAIYAQFLFDGVSAWQSSNNIDPKIDSTYNLGEQNLRWLAVNAQTIQFTTATTTATQYSTSTTATNTIQTTGGIGGAYLYISKDAWVGGGRVVTSANITNFTQAFNGGTINTPLIETDPTQSVSTLTGAIQVAGGVGIGKNLTVGGNASVFGSFWTTGTIFGNQVFDGGNRVITQLNLVAGTGVNLSTSTLYGPSSTLTITNIGVTSIAVNPVGLSITASTGSVTIANTGVTSIIAGTDTAISTATGAVTIWNTSVLDTVLWRGNVTTSTITVNNNLNTSTSVAGNALAVQGGIGTQYLYVAYNGYINGAQIVTTSTLNSFSGGTVNNALIIGNTTAATSTQTGAFQVYGGVGIGGSTWIGKDLHVLGDLYVDGTNTIVNSTSIQTGDKVIYLASATITSGAASGAGIVIGEGTYTWASLTFDGTASWKSGGSLIPTTSLNYNLGSPTNIWSNVYTNGQIISGSTNATSSLTGILQVTGGVGVQKDLWLGGLINVGSIANNTSTAASNSLYAAGGAWITGNAVIGNTAWINGAQAVTTNNPFDVVFTSVTQSFNTQSGALQVAGGVGIGGNLNITGLVNIANSTESTSSAAANALVVSGGINADMININTIGTVAGGVIITTATIANFAFNGGTINKAVIINSATQATSTITGALQVTNGGAGIGGNVWIGGTLNVAGTSTFQTTATFLTTATFKFASIGTGTLTTASITSNIFNTATIAGNALQVQGGIGANYLRLNTAGWINGSPIITANTINSYSGGTINNQLTINTATQAVSTTTGALIVQNGGLGVGGNIWSGGSFDFIDPTFTVDGIFGYDGGLTKVQIGSNTTNKPVAVLLQGSEIARFDTSRNFGLGQTAPTWAIDVLTPNTGPVGSGNTISNYLNFVSSNWNTAFGQDYPQLELYVTSPDSGITFNTYIATGAQSAGTPQALVFAGGSVVNNTGNSTINEYARFTNAGNFVSQYNISSPTATHTSGNHSTSTIAGNAVQVATGGIGTNYLYVATDGWIGSGKIITTANASSIAFNGGTITTPLYINTTTQSLSATSGALRVQGGAGINLNLNVGGYTTLGSGLTSVNNTFTTINNLGQTLSMGGLINVTTSTAAGTLGLNSAALYVAGGLGVVKNVIIGDTATVGSSIFSTSSIAGNALQVTGGIGAAHLYLTTDGWINGSQIVTTGTINSFSGGSVANTIQYTNLTQSLSTNSGALTVAGGVGIGGNLWIGNDLHLLGDLYVDGTQTIVNSTQIQTGDKVIYVSTGASTSALAAGSGIGVGPAGSPYAQLLFDGISTWQSYANIAPSTSGGFNLGSNTLPWNTEYVLYSRMTGGLASTTATNGTLVVTGGAGISGMLNVGTSATIASNLFNVTPSGITQNALYVAGGIGAQYLNIANTAYVNNSPVITAANIAGYQFSGGTITGILTSTNTTSAFSTTTGAIQALGGISTQNNLWVGNAAVISATTASAVNSTSNALYVAGGIGAYSIYLANNGYINGSQIVTAATLNSFSGGTVNASLVINSSTQATSTVTGALQVVNGGMGVGGNIYNGGIHVIGVTANTAATLGTTGTGSLQVLGGGSLSGTLNIGGSAYINNNLGIGTGSPGQALEVNGAGVFGAYNSSRVQIAGNALGSASIYEVNSAESGYRWQIGKDLLTIGVAGIGFINQSQTFSGGGAAVGAVSGYSATLGFYTSNAASMTLRGMVDVSGNWILGVTTPTTPLAKLDVRGSIRFQSGNTEHVITSNNSSQYVALDITRTATGNSSDYRIGINGSSGNFVPTAAAGDATIGFTTNVIYANQATYEVGRWSPIGISIATATIASSPTTGAIQSVGGISTQADLWVGATANITGTTYINSVAYSTSTVAGNALQVKGGIAAATLYLTNPLGGWVNGYQIVTSNNIGSFTGAFNGGTITNPIYVASPANATSTATGAIYTLGGIASTKDLWVGGNATVVGTSNFAAVNASGVVSITNTTTSLSTSAGALVVVGSIGANYIYTLQDSYHSGIRFGAGNGSLTGNIAVGSGALAGTNSGSGYNVAVGTNVLTSGATAAYNSAVGGLALSGSTPGSNNSVLGYTAMQTAQGGSSVAIGVGALKIAAGSNNVGVGYNAGIAITSGANNTLLGYQTGLTLAGGTQNLFLGYQAGQSVTSGGNNVIIGGNNGSSIATSNNNVIVSDGAGNVVMSASGTTQAVSFPGQVNVLSTTTATSTLTGALVITGDMGVRDIYARNIYANGSLVGSGGSGGGGSGTSTSTPYIVVTNPYQAYSTGTTATVTAGTAGAMEVYGGAGIWQNLFVGQKTIINRPYDTSGAYLQVGGDIQSTGNHVGPNLYAAGGNNYLVYSNDWSVSNSNWLKPNASATLNAVTSPDNTGDGTLLTESGATGNHYFQQTVGGSLTGPVTFSIFAKANTRTYIALYVTIGGQQHGYYYNLSTGAGQVGPAPLYQVTGKMEPVTASGWYRCSITVWGAPAAVTTIVGIYNALGFDSTITGSNTSYTGTGGNGAYIWGSQLEPGYYPGNLIINTGSQTTAQNNMYASGSLYIANTATVNNAQVVTTATLMTNLGLYGSTPNTLIINNATNSTSTTTGALQVVNGGIGVGGNAYVGGTLFATAKSFLIDHPTKEGYKLQYGSLEGPENGVYVRGKLEGRIIQLPDYWTSLVNMDSITVDLTPIGKFQKLYVADIDTAKGQIFIDNSTLLGGPCKCFYTVWAERKDIGKLDTEFKG